MTLKRVLTLAMLTGTLACAQTPLAAIDQPDTQRTRNDFENLLNRYPPSVKRVLRDDPNLMKNDAYLAPYPALGAYLKAHSEVTLDPAFYLGGLSNNDFNQPMDHSDKVRASGEHVLAGAAVFMGLCLAACLIAWLTRTFIDFRRWSRLSRVQTEIHTRLIDRFTGNEELLAYIRTPAGSRFLESAPISLEPGSKSIGAPLSRIMWSLQAGIVLVAAGTGLAVASTQSGEDLALVLRIFGTLVLALGIGFLIAAGGALFLSRKMGLFESSPAKVDSPGELLP